ncbi:MAG: hypothetical protein FJ026_04490 [Chloroflexi bacterium]|nr:hypothetical protein [Chloroflexota bacterium]
MDSLPDPLVRTIHELHGEAGVEWLRRLPALLAACAERWGLTLQAPFANLTYNYVTTARCADGTEAVLKAGVPNPELRTEIEALRLCAGRGTVRLLEADAHLGLLLLERLRPGTPLLRLTDDQEATTVAARVMRQLWRPAPDPHPFPTVARWALGFQRLRRQFGGGTGPFPPRLVERAEGLYAELSASSAEPVLLHGDLHHANILRAERQPWLAVDPKGLVGEPAYEVGALLRNPYPHILHQPDVRRILTRRAAQLAEELGFDRTRVLRWAFAQAVLSAWWNYEDLGHRWEWPLACAEVLQVVERGWQ